ncbi:hypothetical protein V8E53_010196 [Lactarius tabidus]
MFSTASLLCVLFLAPPAFGHHDTWERHASSSFLETCDQIAKAVSNASQVFFPTSIPYLSDNFHYSLSSSQQSACSVEPGTAEDVSKILGILTNPRTPFAVKGGGHSTNPGFSSTSGIQISMMRFNETSLNPDGTASVGAGLTWDQVYTALNSTGMSVVGGRVPHIGVGLILGGGYSYKSSQYGLAIDNVVAYEIVLPNGTIKTVTSEDEDLFFGLKGGTNNFGIVTNFVLKTHPQTSIWGGYLVYAEDQLDAIKEAYAMFQEANDTKAAMLINFNYASGEFSILLIVFYDAPTPPAGLFDGFLAIPTIQSTVSTTPYSNFILEFQSPVETGGEQRLVLRYTLKEVTKLTESFSAFTTAGYPSTSTRPLSLTEACKRYVVGPHGLYVRTTTVK